MNTSLFLEAAIVLVGAVGLAQVRITSFNSNGELTWTNSAYRGFYDVEFAASPGGPWKSHAIVADLDWAKTNRLTLQVPVSNTPAFYRVGWILPGPMGVWDYRGYDNQDTLVITGQLSIASMTLLSSNPPVVYGIQGSRNLNYNGSPTNAPWWLGPQFGIEGTGSFSGTVSFQSASFRLLWPTNAIDDNVQVIGIIGPNICTGNWFHGAWGGGAGGPFSAIRVQSTNLSNNP